MSGKAIRFSRFQDHPASRMTESRQAPLSSITRMLNETSRHARNASKSESKTNEIIGTISFHMFFFTLEKMA